MTYKEATEKAKELMDECISESDKIMERAKQQGRWLPGLDSNRDLFTAINMEYQKKIKELWDSIDDWEGYSGDTTE